MGYINVTKKELPPETYINLGLKHKFTVTTPDKWMLNKDLTVINSSYPPTMSSDLVASNFSGYAGYNIPINQIADTTASITSTTILFPAC